MTFFSLWFISIPLFANDLEDAQSCYVKKDYKSALEKFEKYLSQNKNDITAEEYMKLCRSQLEWEQKKNTTFSEIIKKEELTIAKQEIDELTKRGFEYCQMGKYELALYQFEKIISLDEKNKVAKKYRKYIKQKQEEATVSSGQVVPQNP